MRGGVVAAGHPATAKAAEEVLREGGNAFDAVVAAHFAAAIAEPVLCSLAGGGFLLAYSGGKSEIYDFFTHTPKQARAADDVDFYPIMADFGTAQQEFHIGLGSVATPGSIKGLFEIHRQLGSMPMGRLVEPAIELARHSAALNDFQSYIFSVVSPIYLATQGARECYGSVADPQRIVGNGEAPRLHAMVDLLEALAQEGDDLFYRGEVAASIAELCRSGGGHLRRDDLESFSVERRAPLHIPYRNSTLHINPPPSSGGLLTALALDLLQQCDLGAFPVASEGHLSHLAYIMSLTHEARISSLCKESHMLDHQKLVDPQLLNHYRQQVSQRAKSYRGTTHFSIIDGEGNVASMTVSNGEGCGHLIPHTGVMLNNMLGEEDLNPAGFHRWQADSRMSSMMSPALMLFDDGREIALGSGGSNRIRSAILQVVSNIVDFDMGVAQAVDAPRLHLEGSHLSVEGGFDRDQIQPLLQEYPDHTLWQERNLFFGGVHTVERHRGSLDGAGDPRRGGVVRVVGR